MAHQLFKSIALLMVSFSAGLLLPPGCAAEWHLDLESGLAVSGYNDVRYPGDSGTKISLSRDLEIDPTVFWRVRLSYSFGDKHTLSLLCAPLRFESEGSFRDDISFGDLVFPGETPVLAKYRFDSYRLTYRRDFYRREKLRLGIGLTCKIRDAAISLESENQKAEKANTGFVPLINFRVHWSISSRFGFLLDGDALAAPQGRAEDVLAAITARASKALQLKVGYRLLEGGADNDEVYTFALVNYFVLGAVWKW